MDTVNATRTPTFTLTNDLRRALQFDSVSAAMARGMDYLFEGGEQTTTERLDNGRVVLRDGARYVRLNPVQTYTFKGRPPITTWRIPITAGDFRLQKYPDNIDCVGYHADEAARLGLDPWCEVEDVAKALDDQGRVGLVVDGRMIHVPTDYVLFGETA